METFSEGQNLNFAIPSNYLKALVQRTGIAIPLSQGTPWISAETHVQRGLTKYFQGLYQSAIQDYDTAIRLKPDDAYYYCIRGDAKNLLKQRDDALKDFNTALKLPEAQGDAELSRSIRKSLNELR